MLPTWHPTASREALTRRAELLGAIRAYFRTSPALEVDTPSLSSHATVDPAIHSLTTVVQGHPSSVFLQTSPEFPMKRLLAAGLGDIYQICKVFRDGEQGRFHNPEFTLLEWYRLGYDHHRLMQEVEALLSACAPELTHKPAQKHTYRAAFQNALQLDIDAALPEIIRVVRRTSADAPPALSNRDEALDWLMATVVAPGFPSDCLTFIYDYPPSQAALARLHRTGEGCCAARFEVYWGQLELANGFHELTDAREQENRFLQEQAVRADRGLSVPPYDRELVQALDAGLPDCAGVALGIERLLMACLGSDTLADILTFPFARA